MNVAELGIRIENGQAISSTDELMGKLDRLVGVGEGAASALKKAFAGFTLFEIGKKIFEESSKAQFATAQLEAAMRGAGTRVGATTEQLQHLAHEIQGYSTFTHEAVEESESLLLTFDKIRGQQFTRAIADLADLSARMGTDLPQAALQLGKALEDPNTGLMMLRRSGVVFSESQQQVIKDLYNTGQVAQAQDLILKGLEDRFGGSAAAARDTLGGALKGLTHDFVDLFQVSRDVSSGVIAFINLIDSGVKHIHDFKLEIELLAAALGVSMLTKAAISAYEALRRFIFISGIEGAFTGAAAAGTGLRGVLWGLVPAAEAAWSALLPLGIGAIIVTIAHAFNEEGRAAREAAAAHEQYERSLMGASANALKQQKAELEAAVASYQAQQDAIKAQFAALPKAGTAGFDIGTTGAQMDQLQASGTRVASILTVLRSNLDATNKQLGLLGDTTGEVDAKLKAELDARQSEVDKLKALNGAYMQSDLSLKLLTIDQDANIQKSKDAVEHHGKELASLNALTDAQANLQKQAARLAFAKSAKENAIALDAQNAATLQSSNDMLALSRATNSMQLATKQSEADIAHQVATLIQGNVAASEFNASTHEIAAASLAAAKAANAQQLAIDQLKNAQDETAAITAADVEYKKETVGATKQEIDVAQKKHDVVVQAAHDQRAVADATAAANAQFRDQQALNAQTNKQTAFSDSVRGTIAQLSLERDNMIRQAAARREGVAATEALQVALAGEAAARQAENDAAKGTVGITKDEIDAIRKAAEEREKASISLSKAQQVEKQFEQIGKNFIRETQQSVSDFFVNIFENGGSAAEKFWKSFRDLAIKTIGELIAMNMMQTLMQQASGGGLGSFFTALGISHARPVSATSGGGGAIPDSALGIKTPGTNYIGAAGVGAAGLLTAYSLGASNPGSAGGSALEGAASGALAGAAVGSIVPVIGTVVGAVVGATAGLVTSLFGHAKAAKEAKEAEEQVRKQYEADLASYQAALGIISPIQDALKKNHEQADALRDEIEKGYAGRKNQTEREQKLNEANALEAKGATKIAEDFWKDVTKQLNALQGPAGAYKNALAEEDDAYQKNILSAKDLHASEEQIAQIEELHAEKVKQLQDAENDRLAGVQASLDARQAEAQGLSNEAAVIQRRFDEQHQLFTATQEGYTEAQIAQLKYIQSLEDEATRKKALADANQALATAQAAGPNGTLSMAQQANIQPLLDKLATDTAAYDAAVKRLKADTDAGADASVLAADSQDVLTASIVKAGDEASIAAQKFADAAAQMAQASSQIEKDVQLGFTTPQQGLEQLRQALGFGGLTDEQIRAQYTTYNGSELTNSQIDTNKRVEQYLTDLQRWGQQVSDAVGGSDSAKAAAGSTSAVRDAALGLTEATGNRLADYESAHLIEERLHTTQFGKMIDLLGGRVFTGSLSNLNSVVPPTSGPAPLSPADQSSLASLLTSLTSRLSTPSAVPSSAGGQQPIIGSVTVQVVQNDEEPANTLVRRVGDEVISRLTSELQAAQLKDGSTVKLF